MDGKHELNGLGEFRIDRSVDEHDVNDSSLDTHAPRFDLVMVELEVLTYNIYFLVVDVLEDRSERISYVPGADAETITIVMG